MKNKLILNRDKIYTIGKDDPTCLIKIFDKKTNKLLDSFNVYKVYIRKNIVFCKSYEAKLRFKFKNSYYSKECLLSLKKELMTKNER